MSDKLAGPDYIWFCNFVRHDSWLTNAVSVGREDCLDYSSPQCKTYPDLGLTANLSEGGSIHDSGPETMKSTAVASRCPRIGGWSVSHVHTHDLKVSSRTRLKAKGISVFQASTGSEMGYVLLRRDFCLNRYTFLQRFMFKRCVFLQREARICEISLFSRRDAKFRPFLK